MASIVVKATDESLETVNDFIHTELEKISCSPKLLFQFDLAVEEIFVNIAHYAYSPEIGDAEVICTLEKNAENKVVLSITFKDSGVPFNPLERPDPNPNAPLEERGIGGWGIYLTKKYMDSVEYTYAHGKNTLTLTKIIE